MRRLLASFRFLTIIPIPQRQSLSSREIVQSMAYYPVVGVTIGLVLVAARGLLSSVFPHTIVVILLIIILVVLTGGLHLDGLADTVDGLATGKGRQEALRIMRESQVGSFGVVGLTCLVILKFACLLELSGGTLDRALVLATTLGRWSMTLASYRAVYARPEGGLAKIFVEELGKREILLATVFALAAVVPLFGLVGIGIMAGIGALSYGVRRFSHWKLGGLTGDVLGATNEVCESACLLAVLAVMA